MIRNHNCKDYNQKNQMNGKSIFDVVGLNNPKIVTKNRYFWFSLL